MQPYEQRYKPWRYLQQVVEVDRIDAAILAEELAEIYSTPTSKGGQSRKSKWLVYWIDCVFYNSWGLVFISETYAWLLSKHDSSQSLALRENIPNVR